MRRWALALGFESVLETIALVSMQLSRKNVF